MPFEAKVKSMSKREKQDAIEDLLTKLRASNSPGDKKNYRARLRYLGHEGGTGDPRGPRKSKTKGKRAKGAAAKAKGRRARKTEAVMA